MPHLRQPTQSEPRWCPVRSCSRQPCPRCIVVRTRHAGCLASSVYANGRRVADISIDDAGDWADKEGHVVWIGLLEPDAELLHRVKNQFSLHHLAIEDAEHAHQHPRRRVPPWSYG